MNIISIGSFLCMEKNDNKLKSIKVAIKVEKCS
jgi:hypothetical protein